MNTLDNRGIKAPKHTNKPSKLSTAGAMLTAAKPHGISTINKWASRLALLTILTTGCGVKFESGSPTGTTSVGVGGAGGEIADGGGGAGGTGGTGAEGGNGGIGGTACPGGPATVTIEDEAGSYQIRTVSDNGASSSTAGCTPFTQNSIASLGGQPNDKLIIGDDDGFFNASWPEDVCLDVSVACYTDDNGPALPNPPCMSSIMGTWPGTLNWTNLGSFDSATATTGFSNPITCPDDNFAWMIQPVQN